MRQKIRSTVAQDQDLSENVSGKNVKEIQVVKANETKICITIALLESSTNLAFLST